MMKRALACAAVLALTLSPAAAQQKSPYADYQKKTTEAAPLELFELVGEELWKKKQGPKSASLEQCDLGQGPGKLKGAYARLPRYFKDTGEVMDLESRLVHCMMSLQGRSREEILKRPFGNADKPSELEYLSMYVARQSNGFKIDPGTRHPKEKEAYALGEKLFSWRTGLWDFSCTSCHGEEGKRIRASELPQLDDPKQVSPLIATWPAYRVSTSSLITLQWRMNNCFQQMRTAEPIFGSETVNSLITYLTVKSKGATYSGPGIKR
ncbi:MAG TPA: sulfur oxidation c-type cytochrome SoxA [Burkholderiales bacterium]|jgi:sulfur-oxidizing protein SoxA|nr:sulfur oxidation c-type cytochrome SoxA [Burkholderiales bacterium]